MPMFLELGMAFSQVESLFLLNCERSITCLMFLLIIPNQNFIMIRPKVHLVCIPTGILNPKTELEFHPRLSTQTTVCGETASFCTLVFAHQSLNTYTHACSFASDVSDYV